MAKLTKEELPPEKKFAHRVNGDAEEMDPKDRVELLKQEYTVACAADLPYAQLRTEMQEYNVELPRDPDIVNLSEINRKYAVAQSYLTRVSNIEMNAIYVCNLWHSLKLSMTEYLEDRKSALLIHKRILDYPNAASQQAAVRSAMPKAYALLGRIERRLSEADSFRKMVESKKKDLASTITNLKRQVEVVSIEHALQR